jgi:peroxiredoxin Q/BCP
MRVLGILVALGVVLGCTAELPKVGSTAPAIKLADQNGKVRSLADYAGKWVAVAFYPKDMTSGCTVQNKSFTAQKSKFDELGVTVLAISTDTVESHKQFCDKDGLVHILLADPDHDTATKYGVITDKGYAKRTTFVINPNGQIAQVFENVTPDQDAQNILAFVQKAKGLAPAAVRVAVAPEFALLGSDAKTYKLSETNADKGVLVIFVATRCPISRAYEDRMNALAVEMTKKGFAVFGINSNENEPVDEVNDHAKNMKFVVLKDVGSKIADAYGAHATPEAFLLSKDHKIMYHGRIDDNTDADGVKKSDLHDAMVALADGKLMSPIETRAFGCSIKRPKQ